MWRSSASFSSKLLAFSKPSSGPLQNRVLRHSILYSTTSPSSSSPSSATPADPSLKFAVNGIRAFSSSVGPAPTPDLSSFAAAPFGLLRHYGRCYWELSKARLSMLVVATSGTGFVLGSSNAIDFAGLCWTCAGTMMVAASANSLNQVFEIKNDAKMKRTRQRPLPSGRITIPHAITWASSVGVAGTAILASKANLMAAGLAASNLVLYAFVYTPLKQIHPVNTWVGAIVGAIPPLLGWAAASGHVSLNGMILPAALYFWQIPHFMALAYLCREDYAAGGYRMYSLADASGQRTAAVALRNCMYLIPLGYLAYDWGLASGWFCIESSLLTLAISATAFSFYRDRTLQKARKMFYASLLYLPVFMSGLLLHRTSNNERLTADQNSETRGFTDNPSLLETVILESEDPIQETLVRKSTASSKPRPLVAYASVAPFPFLPAPCYDASQ